MDVNFSVFRICCTLVVYVHWILLPNFKEIQRLMCKIAQLCFFFSHLQMLRSVCVANVWCGKKWRGKTLFRGQNLEIRKWKWQFISEISKPQREAKLYTASEKEKYRQNSTYFKQDLCYLSLSKDLWTIYFLALSCLVFSTLNNKILWRQNRLLIFLQLILLHTFYKNKTRRNIFHWNIYWRMFDCNIYWIIFMVHLPASCLYFYLY